MTDVTNLTISSIIDGYKTKKFSVTEIVKAYLERVQKFDKEINSFITLDDKSALEKAKKLDNTTPTSPLHGVPYGIKDMFLTKGVRTTAASRLLENYIPAYSS